MNDSKTPTIGAVILTIIIVVFLFLITQIKVTEVSCRTQYGPCSAQYEEKLSALLKKPLFSIRASDVKKILVSAGGVGEVNIHKHLTGRLEVHVEVEKASVAVQAGGDSNKLWLVTLEGNVVSQVGSSSLPKLIVRSGRISHEDSNFVSGIRLVELLSRARKIENAEIRGNDLTLYTEGSQVILPLEGRDPQVLVGSLQLILERGTIEGKRPVKIDLRFKNAVVSF